MKRDSIAAWTGSIKPATKVAAFGIVGVVASFAILTTIARVVNAIRSK